MLESCGTVRRIWDAPFHLKVFANRNHVPLAIQTLLKQYDCLPADVSIQPLGNHGGFSGARLWRVSSASMQQTWCLRRWPPDKNQVQHVASIHSVLYGIVEHGFPVELIPLPIKTKLGGTWLESGSHVYELARWLPGKADYRKDPTPERLKNAMYVLARFHLAAQSRFNEPDAVPSGIERRVKFLQELQKGLADRILVRATATSLFEDYARKLIGHFRRLRQSLFEELQDVSGIPLPIHPCIRDIQHDHVFFQGSQVSGLVDFGAMAADNVSSDLSRLLASLLGGNPPHWNAAISSYCEIRELSAEERKLIIAYNRSSTLLAGMNWLKWILLENRDFGPIQPITNRLEDILNRLEVL